MSTDDWNNPINMLKFNRLCFWDSLNCPTVKLNALKKALITKGYFILIFLDLFIYLLTRQSNTHMVLKTKLIR